jgi:polysaccharide pyruvyl transferase WcaK-like protein
MRRIVSKVLIVGPHGGHNLGDEFIFHSVASFLARNGERVISDSTNPPYTRLHHGFDARLAGSVKHLRWRSEAGSGAYDSVVVAGGQVIAEGRYHNPLWGHLADLTLARRAAIRARAGFFVHAVGVERITTPVGRRMVKALLDDSVSFTVRDQLSQMRIKEYTGRTVKIVADPVFTIPQRNAADARKRLAENHGTEGPIILICLANDHRIRTDYVAPLMRAVLLLAENNAARVLVLSMEHQKGYDTALLGAEVFRSPRVRLIPTTPFDAPTLMDLFAGVDLVVSARMHPLIVAATQGTAWYALERNDKLTQFARELEQPGLPIADLDGTTLLLNLEAALRQPREAYLTPPTLQKIRSAEAGLNSLLDSIRF